MTASAIPQGIVDYSGFDFERLWVGRGNVSELERTLVNRALRRGDPRRVLEVGTGFGRLLPALTSLGGDVVAMDLDLGRLRMAAATGPGPRVLRVAANVYHLPFLDRTFTAATMIRVYHHLLDPVPALKEVARVLRDGGRFVASYQPTPSIGTFVKDVERAMRSPHDGEFRSVTFSRPPVILDPEPFPIRAPNRRGFRHELKVAGFDLIEEVGAGLEEFRPFRGWSPDTWLRLGTKLGGAPAFPTRFAIARRPGATEAPLGVLGERLMCPRCRAPQSGWGEGTSLSCGRCGFEGHREPGVLDLRYVPPGAPRWGVDQPP